MPLSEEKRSQLDSIVSQMMTNKESDDTIQAVVNDFKTKYGTEDIQEKDQGFLSNAAQSFAKNVVMQPLEAGANILFNPFGTASSLLKAVTSPIKTFKDLVSPYSSWEKATSTLEKDPFRPIVDISMAASGAGGLLRTTGKTLGFPFANKVGTALGTAGAWTDPVFAAEKVMGIPAKFVPESTIRNLFRRPLKPKLLKELPPEQVERSIDYALENKVLINGYGLKKLDSLINTYNEKFDKVVSEAKKYGDTLRASDVLGYLDDTKKFFEPVVGGEKYLKEIQAIEDDFLNRLSTKEATLKGGPTGRENVPIGGKFSTLYKTNPDEVVLYHGRKETPSYPHSGWYTTSLDEAKTYAKTASGTGKPVVDVIQASDLPPDVFKLAESEIPVSPKEYVKYRSHVGLADVFDQPKPRHTIDAVGGDLNEIKFGSTNYYISVEDAMKTKQQTYTIIKKGFGELASATKESQKAIARGIKEEIILKYQEQHPDLRETGLAERDAIKLEHMISDAISRTTKHDLLTLSEIHAATTGAVMGQALGAGAAATSGLAVLTAKLTKNPTIMSFLANKLHHIKKYGTQPSDFLLGARQRVEGLNRIQDTQQGLIE